MFAGREQFVEPTSWLGLSNVLLHEQHTTVGKRFVMCGPVLSCLMLIRHQGFCSDVASNVVGLSWIVTLPISSRKISSDNKHDQHRLKTILFSTARIAQTGHIRFGRLTKFAVLTLTARSEKVARINKTGTSTNPVDGTA